MAELALAVRSRAETLVAVEARPEGAQGETELHVCPEAGSPGDSFDLSELAALWVVGRRPC